MSIQDEPKQGGEAPEGGEELDIDVHHGGGKSIARQEQLKHIRKQHPVRDVPRVDSQEGPEK